MKPRARWQQRNILLSVVFAVIATMMVAGASSAYNSGARLRYVPNEWIISFESGTTVADAQSQVERLGAGLVKALPLSDTYLVRVGAANSGQGYRMTGVRTSAVKWTIDRIQPNYYYYLTAVPDDPYWTNLWGMRMINAPQAWDRGTGSPTVTVAVIDSGVAEHPDLIDRLLPGQDFIEPENLNGHMDLGGHGTHVAGTIAAQGDNGLGVVGVCWDGVQILPARIFNGDGETTTAAFAEALSYVLNYGADVLNLSLGGYYEDLVIRDLIRQLDANGTIVVAAAGNDATSIPSYPAGWPEVISVSALAPNEQLASYSNFGKIDIAAPGGDIYLFGEAGGIYSTTVEWSEDTPSVPTYDYGSNNGTSMACPHVAGAAALLLSQGVPADQVRERLVTTARPPANGSLDPTRYGAGVLDLYAALTSASIRITKPGRGSNTVGDPQFRFTLRGIDKNTIKVYLDYPDADDNGVPDNLADNSYVVVDFTNVDNYLSTDGRSLSFDWPLPGKPSLTAGAHRLYVTGNSDSDGIAYSDWCVFYTGSRVIRAGIHLFAFPYSRSSFGLPGSIAAETMPSDLLLEVGTSSPVRFTSSGSNRAMLTRWLPATSVARAVPYFAHVEDKPDALKTAADRLPWENPMDSGFYTGGGYSTSQPDSFKFPAGAGYWLYLPRDVQINQAYQTMPATDAFNIYLYQGWNMIGNPYDRQIAWGSALFHYRGQGPKTLYEAEAAGWVKSNLFGWDSAAGRYYNVGGRDLLQPFQGYWLRAYVGSTAANDQLTVTVMP